MLAPTTLDLSGERFAATYAFAGPEHDVRARAEAVCVEQTIEFPRDLVPDDDIRDAIIGRIEDMRRIDAGTSHVRISYAVETAGGELPQLLNVLFGNSSLQQHVRLVDVDLPPEMQQGLRGPRFGLGGLRELLDAPDRPLLATALKPMGLPPARLADMAEQLTLGGIDVVKDDHGLANQPFAAYETRVRACAAAVRRGSSRTGHPTLYLPSLNGPYRDLERRLEVAVDAGATGLLALPGLTGFDHLRDLATREDVRLPVMAHPAFLGGFVSSPTGGIDHGVLFGTLTRLAGADMSVFPSYGGRFAFSKDACGRIAASCRAQLGSVRSTVPTPGGGLRVDRVAGAIHFFGPDVMLLVGGDLHRDEDLTGMVSAFRAAAEAAAPTAR